MFYGNDPDGKGHSTRAHLAEVIGILGPPPSDMLKRGIRSQEFFTEDGKHHYSIPRSVSRLKGTSNDYDQDNGNLTWKYRKIQAWNGRKSFLRGGIKRCFWLL
jgi:hypothetical protein